MISKRSRRMLVIDTTVTSASSGEEGPGYPVSKRCRDFLLAVMNICHHVVFTPELTAEWREHRSNFARKWRVEMHGRKKIHDVSPTANEILARRIDRAASKDRDREALQKDFLLVEGALAADRIIASLDEEARRLYSRISRRVKEIQNIVWVNPEKLEEEGLIQWLEQGAKPEKARQIGFHSEPKP